MKATFTPGTTFAGYRVDSLVGRGGMGVVYRALVGVLGARGATLAGLARA